ncbi:MAG: Flp pilus assembly complex ATPase component TadA, partial [Proteobacteria bacterium]|nr:Flp pilus assembly complex ATPase component TadA [Pseudomonadota bacterium]
LYACLNRLNSPTVHIITLEDPVEYDIEGVNQVQINPLAGITFGSGLRSILRQDPDIVMVGEIRDFETASIACQAAQTGHLVFSTLHTNDAPSTITRLVDLGIAPFLISSSLIAVVGQRLVRKICPLCKKIKDPMSSKIIKRLPASFFDKKKDTTFWKGAGCELCNYSGYSGRIGLFEVLIINQALREIITDGVTAEVLKKAAEGNGFQPMSLDGIRKAFQGITTIDEVFRVAPPDIIKTSEETIIQPLEQEEVMQEEELQEESISSFSTVRPYKILIVDDNEVILKILSGILESEGYLINIATNGTDALKLTFQEKPDMIITDIIMPGMDGVALIKKLKAQLATRYIPIIVLTAKDEEDAEVESINAGADDYITKPINAKRLVARINRLLKKSVVK